MKRLHFTLALASTIAMACGGDDGNDDGADTGNDSSGTVTMTDPTMATMTDPTMETMTDPTMATMTDPTMATMTDPTVGDSSSSSDDSVDTSADSGSSTTSSAVTASADLEPKSGSTAMGTATFTDNGDGTADLVVELTGVEPPGTHGLHIHEFPDCSAEDGTSAGMHWNPKGTMLGELGSVEIAEDGTGTFMKTDAWAVGTAEDNDVVDHAIVIHIDNAGGDRIACGVIALD
jgi:superoxide dismutase, Cu-Zn family